jgi:hypothetical protein
MRLIDLEGLVQDRLRDLIEGVAADPDMKVFRVDGDLIGTWTRYRDGLAYEVVIPPIPTVRSLTAPSPRSKCTATAPPSPR